MVVIVLHGGRGFGVIVSVVIRVIVVGVAGRRRLRFAFGFLAEELAVAQAQDALVHADRVRARDEGVRRQAALLLLQGLGVDDDLALAAEVGRHHLLHQSFQARTLLAQVCRPAQDQAGALSGLGRRRTRVAHGELRDQVVADGHAERREVERRGEAA